MKEVCGKLRNWCRCKLEEKEGCVKSDYVGGVRQHTGEWRIRAYLEPCAVQGMREMTEVWLRASWSKEMKQEEKEHGFEGHF